MPDRTPDFEGEGDGTDKKVSPGPSDGDRGSPGETSEASGIYLFSGILLGDAAENGPLVFGLVFPSGMYVNIAYRQLGALARRLLPGGTNGEEGRGGEGQDGGRKRSEGDDGRDGDDSDPRRDAGGEGSDSGRDTEVVAAKAVPVGVPMARGTAGIATEQADSDRLHTAVWFYHPTALVHPNHVYRGVRTDRTGTDGRGSVDGRGLAVRARAEPSVVGGHREGRGVWSASSAAPCWRCERILTPTSFHTPAAYSGPHRRSPLR